MANGDARDGKWRGNWRVEWVASTLQLPRNMVYPALLPLTLTPRLPVVDWNDALADLNGLVRFAERRSLVSACVPSHFKWPLIQQTATGQNPFSVMPSAYCCNLRNTWIAVSQKDSWVESNYASFFMGNTIPLYCSNQRWLSIFRWCEESMKIK